MLLLSLALLVVPQGQVHVVDGAGGPASDFTTLSSALGAAAEGDVVLVRAGDYFIDGFGTEGVYLNGRGLTVVADAGAVVRTNRVQVEALPVTSQVLIQGLTFTSQDIVGELDDDLGPVWLERCTFAPQFGLTSGGFLATSCDALVLARCQLYAVPLLNPSTALLAQDSRLFVFDSTVQGVANSGLLSALLLRQGSFLQLFGSSVHGGDGADGNLFACDGLPGGDALTLADGSSLVTLDSTLMGGAGGAPFADGCSSGADGQDLIVVDGTVVPLAGSARSLDVASPVRTDELLQAVFTGLPADRVWLRYSFTPGAGQASSFYDGEFLLGAPRFKALTATIPASGTLVVTAPAPQLAPGQESSIVYCQAFFRAPGGRFVVSSPSAVVLVDASF